MQAAPPLPSNITLRRHAGFALVVTLSLLVLLTLLALGLLTLSGITIRARQAEAARAEAESNAKLALALALGQLQLCAGPDQRVTATAQHVIDSPQHPHWLGTWQSWRWTPDKNGGKPDFTQKAAKFQNWLVSTADPASALDFTLPSAKLAADQSITLLSATRAALASRYGNSGLEPPPQVVAARLPVTHDKHSGGMAWAVFDENTKAPLQSADLSDGSVASEVAKRTAPARTRQDTLAAKLTPLATAKNIASVGTAELALAAGDADQIRGRFHDFTADSAGVLANAADGGLRVDLTSVMEAPVSLSMAAAFGADAPYFTSADGAPRWDYLRDHYRQYKRFLTVATGNPLCAITPLELTPGQTGMIDAPATERLLPVIAKLQIVFSLVSHNAHITDRVYFLDHSGVPLGSLNHAVPHLTYDPVITLYNPYDVTLQLDKLRVRIWDPPVGFRLRKHDLGAGSEVYYRPEMANGEYHGLARLCILNESNVNARRFFTLYLTELNGSVPGKRITLLPGETRVFSPWVNNDWTWGWETAAQYNPKAFFDWAAATDLGNRDGRTQNQLGVETVPGWDTRAGLQTDHMSYAVRPTETLYDFEKQPAANGHVGGYVSLRLTDEVEVEAKPLRTLPPGSSDPDFMVEVLAGKNNDYGDDTGTKYSSPKDLLRRYKFRFNDVTSEVSASPTSPVITRRFLNNDILQKAADTSPGGKAPFAILTMTAKTTVDPLDDSKAWLYNNPVTEGGEQISANVGAANQSYDLRLVETSDFSTFPGVEIDTKTKRGFFGASSSAAKGVSNVPMFREPLQPASSLGDWVPSNLIAGDRLPRVTHPLGNARAHPLLPAASVSRTGTGGLLLDHSYLINNALWDGFFFSTATDYSGGLFTADKKRVKLLEGFFGGQNRLLNPRLIPVSDNVTAPAQRAATLDGLDDLTRSRKIASEMMIDGAFNINSTSVDAWRAVLSSLRDQTVNGWSKQPFANDKRTPLVRMSLPLAGSTESAATAPPDMRNQIRWAGFRNLDDTQISTLAQEIVKQIRKRGATDKAPSLSLGEFVNRRPGSASSLHALAGLLQTAIDNSGVNTVYHATDSKPVDAANISAARKTGAVCTEAMTGFTGEGAPPILTQGDLMEGLATVAAVRGDTFKIRSYGESNSSDGKVLSRVWCEAVVQRVPGYVDPADAVETKPAALKSSANKLAGRRFVIKSFRWLNPDEV